MSRYRTWFLQVKQRQARSVRGCQKGMDDRDVMSVGMSGATGAPGQLVNNIKDAIDF